VRAGKVGDVRAVRDAMVMGAERVGPGALLSNMSDVRALVQFPHLSRTGPCGAGFRTGPIHS
jgi:hypothetical protein